MPRFLFALAALAFGSGWSPWRLRETEARVSPDVELPDCGMYAGAGATGSDAESEATEDAAREGTELGASTTGATEPGTGRRATALAAGRQPAAGTEARVGAGRSAAGRTAETAEELGEGARRPAERELVDRATTPKGLWEGTTDLEAEFLTPEDKKCHKLEIDLTLLIPWLEMGASLFSSAIRSRTIADNMQRGKR